MGMRIQRRDAEIAELSAEKSKKQGDGFAGRGVDKDTSLNGKIALAVAQEEGKADIIQLLS